MASRIQGITVEIGGDTTKLTTALKGVNGEIRNTQAQLKDVEKLLKLDPSNTELLSQKQQLLSRAVEETKEKLAALKSASEQANQALEDGTITKDQYDALQREIIETEQALERLESQANESATALQKIAQTGTQLQDIGSKIEGVGKKMSVVSAGVTAAGAASAKMAMDFEDAMAKVSTIADTTEVPIDTLQKSIIDLSNQTGISSTEIAQNVYDAISAGQSTGDAVNFVSNSTKLAKAGFADAGAALDVLTTIMNAYGLEASEVNNVSDMLIQTQNLGKTTVGELSSSMGKIIPTANAYGVSLDQLCSGYAIMTSNGVATAESTTYMNSMINELGKSGSKVSKVLMEQTGSSFADLMAKGYSLSDALSIVDASAKEQGLSFNDMWSSSEAAKAGLILLGDSADNFNGTLAKMNDSTGSTEVAFDKLKTNSYSIQMSINQLKNTAIELGTAIMTALAPVIESLSQKITALTQWFSGLTDGQKQAIVTFGLIVAAIGPVLIIVGKIISAVGTIMTILPKLAGVINIVKTAFGALNLTMLANPIFLIIAAITALVAAFIYLWNNCEGFRQFWIDLWNQIKEIAVVVWEGIKAFFQAVWEAIKTIFTTVFEVIKTVVTTYFNIYKTIIMTVLNVIKTVITTVWNAIKTVITTVVSAIQTFITTAWNTIKTVITAVVNAIKTVITTVWNGIKTAITTVINAIKTVISTVWNGIKNTISSVVNGIKNTVTSVFGNILSGIRTTVGNIASAIKSGFQTAIDFITSIPGKALQWGKDMIMGIVNGIKSCIGAVVDAVKGVANTITSFLHFSVPDEGPLTEYESWMPDFMQGLAKGIEKSKGVVEKAVSGVAADMVINPKMGEMQSGVTGGSAGVSSTDIGTLVTAIREGISGVNGQAGDIVIPVYLGGTMLDEVIVNAQQRANLRSGGR